jgi:hypothetical protein
MKQSGSQSTPDQRQLQGQQIKFSSNKQLATPGERSPAKPVKQI